MFTKEKLKAFRKDFNATVAELSKRHNLSLDLGDITFRGNRFTARLTGLANNQDGTVADPDAADLARAIASPYILLTKSMTETPFPHPMDGRLITVTKYRPKAKKYPFVFKYVDTGAEYLAAPGAFRSEYEKTK